MVIKLNKEFEVSKPNGTIDGLQCFVALLRNREAANQIDVKLYLQDYDKL